MDPQIRLKIFLILLVVLMLAQAGGGVLQGKRQTY